jgi:hypothetical protein
VLHATQWTSNNTQFDSIITASTISQRIAGSKQDWQLAYPLHVGSSRTALSCLWVTCNVRHGAKRRVTDDRTYRAQWRQQFHSSCSTVTTEWWISFVPLQKQFILTLEICGIRSVLIRANLLIIYVLMWGGEPMTARSV